MRCEPVFAGIASAGETPDAIGWSSSYKVRGSVVVECKTSVADFLRDKKKRRRVVWKEGEGCVREPAMDKMGDFRYFLTPYNLISPEYLKEQYPDHGLLYVVRGRVSIVLSAPRREANVDTRSEIRLLRFALIHIQCNLLYRGCSVNLNTLAKFFGRDGIEFPVNNG